VRAAASLRAPWFEVSCCPTNVARTLASLSAYVATTDGEGLQLHQYVTGTVSARIGEEQVQLAVTTGYPHDGVIRVRVERGAGRPWPLSLRVPGWATQGASITVDGHTRRVAPGTVTEHRHWQPGDELVLTLPMTPRFTYPDPRIDAVRGCVAVERGPLVMALESVDVPGHLSVNDLRLDTSRPPQLADGTVLARFHSLADREDRWPYTAHENAAASPAQTLEIPLVPYHAWANRGPSTMRVWLPVETQTP
jgi:hypothetical protein